MLRIFTIIDFNSYIKVGETGDERLQFRKEWEGDSSLKLKTSGKY